MTNQRRVQIEAAALAACGCHSCEPPEPGHTAHLCFPRGQRIAEALRAAWVEAFGASEDLGRDRAKAERRDDRTDGYVVASQIADEARVLRREFEDVA